jgi:pimeloyl-ACP methyl ester carboxylesterase
MRTALRASPIVLPFAAMRPRFAAALTILLCLTFAAGGCSTSSQWVKVRDTPRNPLAGPLNLVSRKGPKPTPRTMQLLRRYNLAERWDGDRVELITRLEQIQQEEPDREHEYAMAELAYITAKEAEMLPDMFHRGRALEFYGTSLVHAYRYFFDFKDALPLNAYDPQFRGASDLYNQSLEGMLRLVLKDGDLKPGTTRTVNTSSHECSFEVVMHSAGWHNDDFDHFEFVNDYQVQGLRNHYHNYGLGVPLIAVRRPHGGEDPAEKYYPPNLSFPLTAFLRVSGAGGVGEGRAGSKQNVFDAPELKTADNKSGSTTLGAPRFTLELYDSLDESTIDVAGRRVPLEADLSTPLAYFLNQPQFQDSDLSTAGLLNPAEAKDLQGLYMLEPYDPNKMPVVMVHGLWSSPVTWMEMFNDLRSDPLVRQNYQFWFYLYPTGQPFWFSGTQMREDLAMMRRRLDPSRQSPALDQMVLVGHSMGGLVSRMQTVDSGEEFWQTTSEHQFAELQADEEVKRALANSYFFNPSPSVRRVVTIGTPHRGSQFSNNTTRWLSHKLITLPQQMLAGRQQLLAKNNQFFRQHSPIEITTSIDSLAPESPILPVLLTAKAGPWIHYHNIVGHVPDLGWRKAFVDDGDGVVSLASARLDDLPQLKSQIEVPADHVSVHRHPQSILEVRRLLLEQISELQNFPGDPRIDVANRVPSTIRR